MSVDEDLDTPDPDDTGSGDTGSSDTDASDTAAGDADANAGDDDSLGTQAQVETIGPCKLRLTAEVPAEKVTELLDRNYRDLISTLQLPGFRRGRVPRALVEKRYGEEVEKDLKEALLNDSFLEVVDDKELRVIGAPKFGEVRFDKDTPFSYDVELEVRPEFDLKEYKGVEVESESRSVTDTDIDGELETLRASQASLAPVDLAAAGPEDVFYGSYRLLVKGDEVFSSPETVTFRPADGKIGALEVADLAEKMATFDPSEGEVLRITVTIPEGFPIALQGDIAAESETAADGEGDDGDGGDDPESGESPEAAAGSEAAVTEAELELRIEDAKQRQLPELDDEFAKGFKAESIAELRDQVKESLQARNRLNEERQLEEKILGKIEESVEFELPQGILENQKKAHKIRLQHELIQQGSTKEAIEEELKKAESSTDDSEVRKQLKNYFILEKIAETEKIFATEEDLHSRVTALAHVYGRKPEEIASELERTNGFEEMRVDIRHDKVRKFLRKKAKVLNGGDGTSETTENASTDGAKESAPRETASEGTASKADSETAATDEK